MKVRVHKVNSWSYSQLYWAVMWILMTCTVTLFWVFPAHSEQKQAATAAKGRDLQKAYLSQHTPSSRAELSKKSEKLKQEAAKLFIAIKEKDMKTIVEMIDPDGGLASDKRHMVYYDAVKKELEQKSHYFQHLYGANGVDQELTKLGGEIEIKVEFLYDEDWAGVVYEKVTPMVTRKPASLKNVVIITESEEYHRPKLTFKWKNDRWYLLTLFE